MKLERIALKGFASHAATDWQPNGARLVMLVGDMGSGKSSLASAAPRYAFYGETPANDIDSWVRTGASEMSVLIEFTLGAERYRVTRGRTTRAGGKSFLELHVADGDGWRPLTADSIRETQAEIEQLLHLDAATFQTAVLLVQGKLNGFAEASGADRKRILASLVVDPRFEPAEAVARNQARELAATGAARREQGARLEAELADRDQVTEASGVARHQLATVSTETDAIEAQALTARAAVVALAEQLVAAAAAAEDVHRLTGEVDDHKRRYIGAEQRRRAAVERQSRAEAVLGQRTAVEEASRLLSGIREQVAEAEADDAAHAAATAAWIVAREALSAAAIVHGDALSAVEHAYNTLEDRVTQLSDQVAGLQPVTCPECGASFAADPAGLEGRLAVAGQELHAAPLGLEEPDTLLELRAAAAAANDAVPRASDPNLLPRLRQSLFDAEVLARQAPALAEAERIRVEAIAEVEVAGAEVIAATEAGTAARAALDAARTRGAELDRIRGDRSAAEAEVTRLDGRRHELEAARRGLETAIAQASARLAQLDAAAAELAALQATLAADTLELGRLERLVVAFGVNGIPARIIESVIPELERHADELLEQLGTGMSLSIRSQRARKSGAGVIEALDLIVKGRDGERHLDTFSGGEKTSLSLAIAVAISRLVARRSGAAPRTLIIDEPDGLSPRGRRAFGQALKVLAHSGEIERTIVITHTPDLVDFGDAVYELTWTDAGSVVEQVP